MSEEKTAKTEEHAAEDKEMPFLEHLEELRWRLVRSIVAVIIAAVVAFFISDWVLDFLLQPFRAAVRMQAGNGGEGVNPQLIFLAPTEGFMVRIKLALFAGLFFSLPYVFWQLWQFVAPGLLEHEKRYIPRIVAFSTLFFFAGAYFCYAVVLRYGLNFLLSYQSADLVAQITIKEYLRFVTLLILTFGAVFEMPILTYFLTRMGLLTPAFMRQKRRYSIVAIFIVAAIITPPDVFTQLMLAGPLIVLYEVSIWVSHFSLPKRYKESAAA